MPKKKAKKKGPVTTPTALEEDVVPRTMTTVFTKPNGGQLTVTHDAPLAQNRTERRARERMEAKQLAAEKRRKARSTTGLLNEAVLQCGKDTPEAILQAGVALATGGGGSSQWKADHKGGAGSSRWKAEVDPTPHIPKPRQAAYRQPDLSEYMHPEVAECSVGSGTPDNRAWDGSTDEKRARAIVRSRMALAPPVPGIYDHAPWATKCGPRLRELLRLMQGEVYREGIAAGSQGRTEAKDGTSRCLLCSRVKHMGGVSNIDPEDIDSIKKLCDGLWLEEPDFEGNWDLVQLYAPRVQAALELHANERAMDLLMSWLCTPVGAHELHLARALEETEKDKDRPKELRRAEQRSIENGLPQEQVLRLRVHCWGGLDSLHPNDELGLREILAELPIHVRFLQAALEKHKRDVVLIEDELRRLEPAQRETHRERDQVPRVFKQRWVQATGSDDPYWYGDSPQYGQYGETFGCMPLSAFHSLGAYMSIAHLPGETACERLEFHNRNNARPSLRTRDTFGLDVLEATGRDQVLDVLHALQPPELMEDIAHLSHQQLRQVLKPHELAIHLHKPSPRCIELRKGVALKSFLAGIHPKDTRTIRALAERQFWPPELIRAGLVYQLCSLCERQSGQSSYSRECAAQMARINAVLGCDPDDTNAANWLEEFAQGKLDNLLMWEIRDGGANSPWPYELQPLLSVPGFSEELAKASVHSLQEWGAKIVDSMQAIPMFAAVEDLPEENRDQLVKKNRFRNGLNELVSLLRNDEIYYEEFHDRMAKLADKRRGTRPTLSDPIEMKGTKIKIRQTNAYADRIYDTQLGDDWLDSADSHFNSDRLNLWTPGMVAAWIKQDKSSGLTDEELEKAATWALTDEIVGGLSALHATVLSGLGDKATEPESVHSDGSDTHVDKKIKFQKHVLKRIIQLQSDAAQLDCLWNERAKNFAAELADRTRHRHVVKHIPRRPRCVSAALLLSSLSQPFSPVNHHTHTHNVSGLQVSSW